MGAQKSAVLTSMRAALLVIGQKTLPTWRLKRKVATWMRLKGAKGRIIMPAKGSKRLVIDASVARAAGGKEL
jgi:hypothetical protein